MKFKFSWINYRKSLIFSSLIDYLVFYYIFFFNFKEYISDKYLLLFLLISSSLLWIITSYILGRYTVNNKEKIYIVLNNFLKTTFVLVINLLFSQIIFRIFWNWNYMNFESFSNFVNVFSLFYLKIYFFSNFLQISICLFLSNKYTKKSLWMFWGNNDRKDYLKKLIGKDSIHNIILFNNKYSDLKAANAKGIIIDNEEEFAKENIKFLFHLNNRGLKLLKISNWCERYLNRYPSDLVKSSEIIDGLFNYNENSLRARIKRIGESIISIIILLITFPILVISSILIKLEDGGPIFYSQNRNGFEGKKFKIIKLRSMIINAEKDGVQWSNKSDKRVTKVGYILRKLRIDELPQLLLVITGEMSLIGPRPERPNIDNILRDEIPNYDLRYSIKPGISGWAQVNYPYGASIEDAKFKLSYDLYYIKNFSILLDCMILFKTIRLVLHGEGSRPKIKQHINFNL